MVDGRTLLSLETAAGAAADQASLRLTMGDKARLSTGVNVDDLVENLLADYYSKDTGGRLAPEAEAVDEQGAGAALSPADVAGGVGDGAAAPPPPPVDPDLVTEMDALQQDLTGPQYAATRALYTGEGVMTAADWDAAEAAAARPPPTTEAGAEREAEFVEQSLAGMAGEMEARAVELSNVQSSVEQALQATAADARAARRPIIAALAAGPVSGEGRGADSNVAKLQREAVHRLVSGQLIYHDIMEQLGGEAAIEHPAFSRQIKTRRN